MGYGAVSLEDLNFIFIFKIILSTHNSSDIELVKDIVSVNKVTIRYLKFSLYFIFLPTRGFTCLDTTIIVLLFMSRSVKYYN